MALAKFPIGLSVALVFASAIPVLAQLSPAEPDPLARIRDAAKSNVQACSATGETLCEQVAPKIIANAQSDSPLAENVRGLTEKLRARKAGTSSEADVVSWAVAAFRDAGVDVHTEKHSWIAVKSPEGTHEMENVVAEIRGREKPDEWVLLGAHLDISESGAGEVGEACDAALVIEAARDIHLTSIHPRRSIRLIIFTGRERNMFASWAYVRAHRDELDRARAAIVFDAGASRVAGFTLYGRHDIESGVREAMKPIDTWDAGHHVFSTPVKADSLDFLLEGIPTLLATAPDATLPGGYLASAKSIDAIDIRELKRNTAIAAVTAFGIAERAEPIGPRQSRAEIESLLKTSGLEQQMKAAGLWPLWESGERGRMP